METILSKKLTLLCLIVLTPLAIIFGVFKYNPNDTYYKNGVKIPFYKQNFMQDIKKVTKFQNIQQLTDYPKGYSVKVPSNMMFDFNYSTSFDKIYNSNLEIKISKEHSPYDDMKMYFEDYLNRFIMNKQYCKNNNIDIITNEWKNINGYKTRIVSFKRNPLASSKIDKNEYLFAYMITDNKEFYNFFLKTNSLEKNKQDIELVLNSFTKEKVRGKDNYNLDLKPELPNWNAETLAFYEKLKGTKKILWGFFTPNILSTGQAKLAEIEKKLDYHFPILLYYTYLDAPFPIEQMNKAYEKNEIIELTMQVASFNNDNSPSKNANFELLDGASDEKIRKFARDAKKFGHPFLLRLNNEMNSDWCQYSGLMTLSDTDIYTSNWHRIYNIFEQEGVNNAIWIFNPNDRTYPPTNWNSPIAYYPGNKYVHMIGLTGYNTGDYYKDLTGETWRTFDEIYSPLLDEYRKIFAKFPYIITEFSSSSVGGDKEKWINDMFKSLPKYPEIKAAVWWSYFDPDSREGKNNAPARKYWLDEKDEYLQAFKKGIHKK